VVIRRSDSNRVTLALNLTAPKESFGPAGRYCDPEYVGTWAVTQ